MEYSDYPNLVSRAFDAMKKAPADQWRPGYHLTPLAGTLGDPNGLCQRGDVFHIFYVTSPLACKTTQRTPCVWGHYTTTDFVHYIRQPVALWPDDRRDRDGVYSGSALCANGTLFVYYTGNVRHHGNYDYIHAGREQNVLRSESTDGVHFTGKQLLLTNDDYPDWVTQHVRDPQVLAAGDKVLMILGARTQADEGCALVYESADGVHFSHKNTLRTAAPFGYMWECPDYAVVDGQPLLICCPQGVPHEAYRFANSHQCGCFPMTGELTGPAELGDFVPFDYGFDYYAARTLKAADGRVILFGWMGMSECDYGRTPSAERGWDQVLAMPRELHWENGTLRQTPLRELQALRGQSSKTDGAQGFAAGSRRCRLRLDIQPGSDVTLSLFEDGQLHYSAAEGILTLTLGQICGGGRAARRMKCPALGALELYLDSSALEIFVNGGEAVLTSRIFGAEDRVVVKPFAGTMEFCEMNAFVMEDADADPIS